MSSWRSSRPFQPISSHKNKHLQELCKRALEKTGDLSISRALPCAALHHLCPSKALGPPCPALVSKAAPAHRAGNLHRYTGERRVSVLAENAKCSQCWGQPAFKLDCKHWRFPWLPKNTYQQLPVPEGQIPVSSTNSVLLLCPFKNREGGKK